MKSMTNIMNEFNLFEGRAGGPLPATYTLTQPGAQGTDAPYPVPAEQWRGLWLILAAAFLLLARPAGAAFALYTADGSHNTILKLNAQGQATVFATNGVHGVLDQPLGLVMDDRGYLYVANYVSTNTIEVYDTQGNGSLLGSIAGGGGNADLVMDGYNNVYLSEGENVQKFSNPSGQSSLFVNLATAGGEAPFGLAFDNASNLYVGDFDRGKIYKVDSLGNTTPFVTLPASPTPNPIGLAFDSSGNLYVALYGQSDVLRYSPPATNAAVFVSGISDPYGLAFDSSNYLYVASLAGGGQIYKVDPTGATKTVFANAASGLTGTGFLVIRETRYQDNWNKVAGGGGTSTNGEFVLNGTAGQRDAGTAMVGGEYGLVGGFWARISTVPTAGAPLLTITLTQTNTAMVSWPYPSSGWSLQQNTNVNTTNWVAASETVTNNGTINYIIVNPPTGNLYFRLMEP